MKILNSGPRRSPAKPRRFLKERTPPPRTSFRELHVALILLRHRAGRTQREVALESGAAVSAVGHSESADSKHGSLKTVDTLLTYYGADLALCHKLILVARRHLGDLRRIRGPKMLSRRKAQEIWEEADRLQAPAGVQELTPPVSPGNL